MIGERSLSRSRRSNQATSGSSAANARVVPSRDVHPIGLFGLRPQGKSGDRVGFFPANFVQRVRPGERVWRVVQGATGSRERGHMAVKESQVQTKKKKKSPFLLSLSPLELLS